MEINTYSIKTVENHPENIFDTLIAYIGMIPIISGLFTPITLFYAIGWNIITSQILEYFAKRKITQIQAKMSTQSDNFQDQYPFHNESSKLLAQVEYYILCQHRGFRQIQHAITELIPILGNLVSYKMYQIEHYQIKDIFNDKNPVTSAHIEITSKNNENNLLPENTFETDEKIKTLMSENESLKNQLQHANDSLFKYQENERNLLEDHKQKDMLAEEKIKNLFEESSSLKSEIENANQSLSKYNEKNEVPKNLLQNVNQMETVILELKKDNTTLLKENEKLKSKIIKSLYTDVLKYGDIINEIDEIVKYDIQYYTPPKLFKESEVTPEYIAGSSVKMGLFLKKVEDSEVAKLIAIRTYAYFFCKADTEKIKKNNNQQPARIKN